MKEQHYGPIEEHPLEFIVLAPNSWQGQWMNRQQLFSRIAANHRVVYSCGPFFLWQRHEPQFKSAHWLPKPKKLDGVILCAAPIIYTRIPKIAALDNLATKKFCRYLENQTSHNAGICLYLFHPKFLDYTQGIKHSLLVYHAYDDFSKQGLNQSKSKNEEILLREADIVFASSSKIKERLEKISGRKDIIFLPNGVDYEHFSTPTAIPDELAKLPGPKVAYTGSINKKVDLELLLTIAEKLPDTQFIMIGPIGELDASGHLHLLQVKRTKNIHLLGEKQIDEIPAYMQHVDINVMIYKSDESTWASSGYPLKLHEYLAVGKPIVSADIDAVREFASVLKIAKTPSQWVELLTQELQATPDEQSVGSRKKISKSNTWNSRVDTILDKIQEKSLFDSSTIKVEK